MTQKNKTWLTFTALAMASGMGVAQSQVSIYGMLDLSVAKSNGGNSVLHGAPANDSLALMQGARSRIGLRGTEDLGGGLKANFALEHSFTPDNGAALSSTFWHGLSWVGVSGGFGEVRLGRDFAPAHQMAMRADPFGFDTVAQVGVTQAWIGFNASGGASRLNNSVSYKTPSFGGVSAQVALSLSEVPGQKNEFGANLVYAKGPAYLGVGYHKKGDSLAGKNDLIIATGTYTFSAATARLSHSLVHLNGQLRRNYTIGLNVPVGEAEIRAVANQHKMEGSEKTTKFGLGYHYKLSKRTKLYTDIATAKTNALSKSLSRTTAVDVGIQHWF